MRRNTANLLMVGALLGLGMTAGCIGGPSTEESGEGIGRRGRACGARLGDTCRRNQYCEFSEAAMCGATDMTGVCRPRPQFCIELYDPVCGCDGQTYSSSCFAASAGTSVAYEGECEPPEPRACGGIAGLTCGDGEYCAYTTDQQCGAADQMGVCAPRPQACIQLYDPVCGCDGQTHGNACSAASAGVSVAHAGECVDETFCGGIAGLPCPDGMVCELDGDYPDAGGHCVEGPGACPLTGIVCTEDCGADGRTPGGAPCQKGNWNESTCECVPPSDIFCGGIAAIPCPEGMVCELDGNYPDAGGHCVAAPADCRDTGCEAGWSCVNCFAGWQCLPPDAMCAF